jgi:Arc/MetJ-type ribon-helix-helix transcriptional regulator
MARATTTIALSPSQLREIRKGIDAGMFKSADDAVRQGLRLLLEKKTGVRRRATTPSAALLEQGYREWAEHDRKCVEEWSKLNDPWPEE